MNTPSTHELLARVEDTTTAIPILSYPDGMPRMSAALGRIDRLLLRPRSLTSFMAALFYVDALVDRGHPVPELILPFLPGARQDRLNDTGDFLFTAKSVARELNARQFPRVTVVDPHSEVMPGLIDRCRVVHASECIPRAAFRAKAVVSPDAGAEKRAGAVARQFEVPLYHAWKTRDVATGKIAEFGAEPFFFDVSKYVLVVDDICDGGGTFIGLADVLIERGIKPDLWVTHGIFSQGTTRLRERFEHIYTTDSVAGPRDGVTEFNVSMRLLEAP